MGARDDAVVLDQGSSHNEPTNETKGHLMTFTEYLHRRRNEDSVEGDVIRDVLDDPQAPTDTAGALVEYLDQRMVPDYVMHTVHAFVLDYSASS